MTENNNKKNRKKKITIVSSMALCVVLCLFFAMPTALSTDWGRRQLLHIANKYCSGKVEIEKLHLNWTQGQKIENIQLYDRQGKLVGNVDTLSTSSSLWTMLFGTPTFAEVQICKPTFDICFDEHGKTNIEQMFTLQKPPSVDEKKQQNTETGHLPFFADVQLQGGSIKISGPNISPITISDLQSDFSINSSQKPLDVTFHCNTQQGEVKGSIQIEAHIEGIKLDRDFTLQKNAAGNIALPQGAHLSFDVHAKNLPLEGVDQLLALDQPELKRCLRTAFGPSMNIDIASKIEGSNIAATVRCLSEKMQLSLQATGEKEQIRLETPATLQYTITPQMIEWCARYVDLPERFLLQQNAACHMTLDQLCIPIKNGAPDFSVLQCSVQSKITEMDIRNKNGAQQIIFNAMQMQMQTTGLNRDVALQYSVDGQYNRNVWNVGCDAKFSNIMGVNGQWQIMQTMGDGKITTNALPLDLIDILAQQKGLIVEALGPKLDMQVLFNKKADVWTVQPSIKTERMHLEQSALQIDEQQMTLLKPLRFSYLPSKIFLQNFLTNKEMQLDVTSPLQWNVQSFEMPLEVLKKKSLKLDKGKIQSELLLPQVSIRGLSQEIGSVDLRDIKWNIQGSSFAQIVCQAEMSCFSNDAKSLLCTAVGPKVQCIVEAKPICNSEKECTAFAIETKVHSDLLQLAASAELDSQLKQLKVVKPWQCQYTLTPALVQKAAPGFVLAGSSAVQWTIDPCQIALDQNILETINCKSTLRCDVIILGGRGVLAGTRLHKVNIAADCRGAEKQMQWTCYFQGQLPKANEPFQMHIESQLDYALQKEAIDLKQSNAVLSGSFDNVPIAFAEVLTQMEGRLVPLLGSTAKGQFKTNGKLDLDHLEGKIDCSLVTSQLKVDANFLLQDQFLMQSQTTPALIKWTITPQGFDSIFGAKSTLAQKDKTPANSPVTLQTPTTLSVVLSQCKLPMSLFSGQEIKAGGFLLDVRLNKTTFVMPTQKQAAVLEGFQFSCKAPDWKKNVEVAAQGNFMPVDAGHKSAIISMQGQVQDLFNSAGNIDIKNITTQMNVQLQDISMIWAKELLPVDKKQKALLQELVGSFFSVKANAQLAKLNGPLSLAVQSSNIECTLDSNMKQGKLFLRKDLLLNFLLTKSFCSQLNQFIDPDLIAFKEFLNPVSLQIAAEGFEMPIIPFKKEQLQLRQARLQMGKVRIEKGGMAEQILNLLHLQTPGSDKEMTLWWTPILLRGDKGIIQCERADALLGDRVHLASWGSLNLPQDRIDMTAGITAETLEYALKAKGLSADYVLQIPIQGSLSNVKVDTSKASLRLGSLLARRSGRAEWQIFGNVLDAVTNQSDTERAPPAPSRPYPWEKEGLQGTSKVEASQQASSSSPAPQQNEVEEKKRPKDEIKDLLKLFR